MKNLVCSLVGCLVLFGALNASAQKKSPAVPIFAVVNDGKSLEPIAFIDGGQLKQLVGDDSPPTATKDFIQKYYKPKTRYNVIFGGKTVGTATVVKDLADTECAANQAEVTISAGKFKPKGFLMALATSAVPKKTFKGLRDRPTWPERAEINELVFEAFKAEGTPIKNSGELRYQNLTKVDVDSDGRPEFIGSYWYNTGPKTRTLLFFIAGKGASGKIAIDFKNFGTIKEDDVMSGDIKDIDNGVYHELLLDMFDVDGDGTNEIFTISPAFEGSNFFVYHREKGVWKQIFDTSNYHCGY